MLLTAELVRVLELLHHHGVAAVPFKGPTLAAAVYGDVAQRQFSDLDILICPSEWPRAQEAMMLGGYAPEYTLSGRQEHALLATGYECAFVHEKSRAVVEVQWALLPRFYAVHCAMEDMFARSRFFEFQGRRVRTLDPNDLLLAVSVHAAKHLWRRFCWLMDIVQMVRTQLVDWGVAQARAREWGVERMLLTGLLVSRHMLGADLPAPVRAWVESDLEVNSLAGEVSQYIVQNQPIDPESPAYFRLISRLRERRLDRGKFFWRLAVTPSFGEWSAVRLPDWLFPLYRGVRIGRLLGRALKK